MTMRTRRKRIFIARENGPVELDAWVADGIAYHRTFCADGSQSGVWGITHVGSGRAIGYFYDTQREARRMMKQLLALGIDWTLPPDALLDHSERIYAVAPRPWRGQDPKVPT